MREIKFRGWHVPKNTMFSAEEMAADQLTLLTTGSFINVSGDSTRLSQIMPRDKFIPMQYTGLKDKQGCEIYEGDILKYPSGEIVTVIWMVNPASFSPKEIDILHAPHIIGNIYENPELMED